MLFKTVLFHTLIWIIIMEVTHKYLHGHSSIIPTFVAYSWLMLTVSWKTVLSIRVYPYNQIVYLNGVLGLTYMVAHYSVIDLAIGWWALIMLAIGAINFLIIRHIHKTYRVF